MIRLYGYMLLILLAGCQSPVPATTPPQLNHTPGAFVSVTDEIFDAGAFQVRYPEGWRVVKTSIAASPVIDVVFVSPDDELTIRLSEAAFEPPDTDADTFSRYEQRTLSAGVDVTLFIYAEGPLPRRAALQSALQRLLESLQAGDNQ